MTRKPKSIQNHYVDSFTINYSNLKYILNDNHGISDVESEYVSSLISTCYNQKTDIIVQNCGEDWTKLESFSSPLILFLQCIDKIVSDHEVKMSVECKTILKSYLKSLESWMIW